MNRGMWTKYQNAVCLQDRLLQKKKRSADIQENFNWNSQRLKSIAVVLFETWRLSKLLCFLAFVSICVCVWFWNANLLFCPFSFIVHNCLQYFRSLLCSVFILVLDSRKGCISDHNFVIISTKSLNKCIILKNISFS